MVTMDSQSPLDREERKVKYIKILLKLFFKYPIIISDKVKFPPSPPSTLLSITLILQRRLNLGTELKILLLPKDIVTVRILASGAL